MDQPYEQSKLQQAKERWEAERLDPALAKVSRPRMPSDVKQQRLYTPLDGDGRDYENDLGFPGQYPYTRGVQPSMYQGRLWTMRQYAGFGTPEETHERFEYLLNQGQGGLLVAYDLPTQLGFDSDDDRAKGEVGVVGVAVDSLADMETIFSGLPLEKASPSLTMNAAANVALAMYVAVAEKEGVPAERISGTTKNDILKEFIARGTQVFPPRDSLRLTVDVIEYCTANLPRWNAINICGYHVREAGSTLVQEVAFALANAITYIEACLERGMDVDAFAPRLAFNFSASANIFQEAAKFRATRRMWARLLQDRFGAKQAASLMFRTGAGSAGSTLTAQQPENNIVRVALQALSGILGGVQSFHSASFDEALAIPTEHSALVALRTQQVLAHESGAAEVIDPLGGSYYVEALTDQIEAEVNLYIAQIEADGGMLQAIEDGRAQAQIAEASFAQQQQIDAGEKVMVGVNQFQDDSDPKIELHRPNPEIVAAQIAKLQQLRRERDNGAVQAALVRLEDEARGDGNLMYPILEAVRAYATIGEICGVERKVFGEYQAASI